MISFYDWLTLEGKGWQKQAPGGAFGKSKSASQGVVNTERVPQAYYHTRDQHGSAGYNQRIAFGLSQEPKIIQAAKACNIDLLAASANQDMNDGIDAWWRKDGQLFPVQIKYRDKGGNDLGFEVLNPFAGFPLLSNKNKLGRDFKFSPQHVGISGPNVPSSAIGKKGASYILHLDSSGTKLTIVDTKPCYQIILNLLSQADREGKWLRGESTKLTTGKGTLLLKKDDSSGVQKVLAYIPINIVGVTKQCDVNVTIG